jgi:hypothetical protein
VKIYQDIFLTWEIYPAEWMKLDNTVLSEIIKNFMDKITKVCGTVRAKRCFLHNLEKEPET